MELLRKGPIPEAIEVQGITFGICRAPTHQKVGGVVIGKVAKIDIEDFSVGAGQGIAGTPATLGFVQNLQVDQWLVFHGVKDHRLLVLVTVQVGKNVGGTVAAAGRIAQSEILSYNVLQRLVYLGLQLGKDGRSQHGINVGLVKVAAGKTQQQTGAQNKR